MGRFLTVSELPRKLLGFLHLASPAQDPPRPQAADAAPSPTTTANPPDGSRSSGGSGNDKALLPADRGGSPRSHVSPLATIQRFLSSLTQADADGRVVLWREASSASVGETTTGSAQAARDWRAKFIVLNPAVHFQQITDEAHAVVLLGGTMQPFDHVTQTLLPGLPADRLHTFTCGHVIAPSNICPLTVARGPTNVQFDFRFQSRASAEQLDELGRLLVNVCNLAPAGVVCFLPSYDYERRAVDHWTLRGTLRRLRERKRIFREPRAAAEVDGVLAAYARAIAETTAGHGQVQGALLFCVVGAKMSEGINFSDDLARCVIMVGLPYPDRSDPELRQKMAFLDARQLARRSGTGGAADAGNEYYENLCMRAVNQSIGRAIRHARDYAAILLVDHRYATRHAVARKLPGWIATELQHPTSFGGTVATLSQFFKGKCKGGGGGGGKTGRATTTSTATGGK